MNRPARLILTIAATFSFLLCVTTTFFWIRSHWFEDYLYAGRSGGPLALLFSSHGSLWIGTENGWPHNTRWTTQSEPVSASTAYSPAFGVKQLTSDRSFPGLQIIHATGWLSSPNQRVMVTSNPPARIACITINWGLPTMLAGILPTALLLRSFHTRRRLRHRQLENLCPTCGYDLRATPNRCPECGTVKSN